MYAALNSSDICPAVAQHMCAERLVVKLLTVCVLCALPGWLWDELKWHWGLFVLPPWLLLAWVNTRV